MGIGVGCIAGLGRIIEEIAAFFNGTLAGPKVQELAIVILIVPRIAWLNRLIRPRFRSSHGSTAVRPSSGQEIALSRADLVKRPIYFPNFVSIARVKGQR